MDSLKKQTILVVDDSPESIDLLSNILRKDYSIIACIDGEHAADIAENSRPDIVLLDVKMNSTSGFAIYKEIKRRKLTPHIPVIFITAQHDTESEARGLGLGAVDYITKPFNPRLVYFRIQNQLAIKKYRDELEQRVEVGELELAEEHRKLETSEGLYLSLLNSMQDGVVLITSDGKMQLANPAITKLFGYKEDELVGKHLKLLFPKRHHDNHPLFRNNFFNTEYDVTVTDDNNSTELDGINEHGAMPGDVEALRKDGIEFYSAITLNPIVVSGQKMMTTIIQDVTERKMWERKLSELALTDPLTGLSNRNRFNRRIEHYVNLQKRNDDFEFSLMMIDLDKFKPVNDTYGHLVGDELLVHAANILKKQVREVDMVARLGGDEFAVLCNGSVEEKGLRIMAERIIKALSVPYHKDNNLIRIGASIGIAYCDRDVKNADELIRRADLALYQSKNEGRNQVNLFCATTDKHQKGNKWPIQAVRK